MSCPYPLNIGLMNSSVPARGNMYRDTGLFQSLGPDVGHASPPISGRGIGPSLVTSSGGGLSTCVPEAAT